MIRLAAVALVLAAACTPGPVAVSPAPPTASRASPSEASAARSSASEVPTNLVAHPAGDLTGEHALVAQVTTGGSPSESGVMHIWAVPMSGGSPRELVTYPRGSRAVTDFDLFDLSRQLSPDGRRLVLTDPEGVAGSGLAVIDLVGGGVRVHRLDGGAAQPAWSPDGTRIAYRGYAGGSPFATETGVWVIPASGGQPVNVWRTSRSTGSGALTVHAWTGDGSGVAISRDTSSVDVIDVTRGSIAPIFSGEQHGLAFRAKEPTVAIAVTDPRGPPPASPRGAPGPIGTTGRVEVRDTPAATSRVAFHHDDVGTLLFDPRWNPQTDEILLHWICGAGAQERDELVIVDAAKSSVRTLPVTSCVSVAEWNADGTKVVYGYLDSLRLRNADGSGDRELFHPSLPSGATQGYLIGARSFVAR